MNRKQLLLLVVLVVVLGGTGWFLFQRNSQLWSQASSAVAGSKLLKDFPINDVAKITIRSATGEVNLVRGEKGWGVAERGQYPASFEQISRLLKTLWDLKIVQDVKAGPSQFGRLQLVEPAKDATDTGTLVDLLDANGKRLASVILGKEVKSQAEQMPEGYPVGRYAMALDSASQPVVVSELLNEAAVEVPAWLNKDFFKVERMKSVALSGTAAGQQWKITRAAEDAEWQLEGAKPDEKLDTGKLPSFGSALAAPTMIDVLPAGTKPESVGLDQPITINAETFDGFNYVLRAGRLDGEQWPVQIAVSARISSERTPAAEEKPEDKTRLDEEFAKKKTDLEAKLAKEKALETHIFQITKFTVDSLLKDRSTMLMAAEPAPAATPFSVTTEPVSVPAAPAKPAKVEKKKKQ